MKKLVALLVLPLMLVACGAGEDEAAARKPAPDTGEEAVVVETVIVETGSADEALPVAGNAAANRARLAAVLAQQPEENQARYPYRHPQETLEFFGIEPGMTVVEALPGGGWYSAILLPYLGEEGRLIGADYAMDMWPYFDFGTEEFIEKRKGWVKEWPEKAQAWRGEQGASVEATRFGEFPEALAGTVDAVLFIRALHNLNRFESTGGYLSQALADAMMVLKPGGIVGVVQHRAPDQRTDAWADGSHGYLKMEAVVAAFENAGFEFLAENNINANPADDPGPDDIVWRLPPSLSTSKDNPELRAQYEAIGESNRMTLLFRKPLG